MPFWSEDIRLNSNYGYCACNTHSVNGIMQCGGIRETSDMHDLLELVSPLERLEFDTQQLLSDHPPVWEDKNKRAVFEVSSPVGCTHEGRLLFTRWPAMPLPEMVNLEEALQVLEARSDVYDYAPVLTNPDAVEWHVNFADPNLFSAYGSPLMAQDELQVAEHPALGAIKEALDAGLHTAQTMDRNYPTPVLIMGVERRCQISTGRNAEEGRPDGLYGNHFSDSDVDVVRRATRPLSPPTMTNLMAMSAPSDGYGRYDRGQIERILVTAYTAFRAGCLEADRASTLTPAVAVHTGFWGCGAYGGNRVIMAMLQIVAAGMAGVDRLVFHTVDEERMSVLNRATRVLRSDFSGLGEMETREVCECIYGMGFEWGMSNGT